MSPRESIVRELSLEELLLDLVMRRDGVRERDIRALAERAAENRA